MEFFVQDKYNTYGTEGFIFPWWKSEERKLVLSVEMLDCKIAMLLKLQSSKHIVHLLYWL